MSSRLRCFWLLLTHDRVWYEIVRLQTEASRDWLYHELYYATTDTGYECPVHRGHNEGWPDLLKRARQHLHDNDERAAAVYAQAAFEQKLQRYCARNAVPVRYHTDPRRMDAQWFWDAIIVATRIRLTRENNGKVMFRGQYAAITEAETLDMSVLGRDVTNLFTIIVDWPQRVVCLLGQQHRYTIAQQA